MQKEKSASRGSKNAGQAARLLDVYIRNNNKQALLVHTQQNANLTHISSLIATRFQVPPSDQLLFYNGQQVATTSQRTTLEVEDKSVIHLVDRRNVTEDIVINVRRLSVPRVEQFRVSASQVIEDFIVRNIQQQEQQRLFFVYTGRELNPRRSFAQEFVENRSEIFCLDEVKDEVVGERREKYEKKLKKKSKKELKVEINKAELKLSNQTIKEASVQESQDITFNASTGAEREKREEKEEIKTPNFKKKNMSEEINLANNDAPTLQVIAANSHQNSTSLVIDQFQENKSSLAPNLFNEGSIISSICSQENHNPESSKRLDEPSVMFNSAYMGLTNDNQLVSRGGSIIANQSDSPQQEPQEGNSKISFSFDNRAPEMMADRQMTALDREEIIQQSKEDYSESRESPLESPEEKAGSNPKTEKENSKDLSGYELESIEHHQLSASAQLEVEIFENKDSPPKGKDQNQILIEDFQRNEDHNQDLGVDIEPIAYSHHQLQHQQQNLPCSLGIAVSNGTEEATETPHFDQTTVPLPRQLDVYVIEHSQLAQATESQMVEQKEERETNRHSSNFYSNSSSRAKQYDINNQYNFGQFQRFNRNRFSGYRQGPSNESEIQTSKSERSQEEQQIEEFTEHAINNVDKLTVENTESNRKKSIDDDHSLNIVELPIEARIKENSSLLIDYQSKSDLPFNHDLILSEKPQNDLEKQNSGIDELNRLLQVGEQPINSYQNPSNKQSSAQSSSDRETLELVHHEHEHPVEEVIETSLNLRMSRRQSKQADSINSPVIMKEIKGVIDSAESLEKIEVKNSLPYFNSYSRSISSQVRFTNHKEIYNIGDFVFNCEVTTFNPLAFFIEALSKQDSLDVYRSYP